MAEYCLACFNRYILSNGERPYTTKEVALAAAHCEICREEKLCVMRIRPRVYNRRALGLWPLFKKRRF